MRSGHRRITLFAIALITSSWCLSSTAVAQGQCFGPDNLDIGPCCGPAIPNLPVFPDANPPALGICWGQCSVIGTQDLKVTWPTLAQVSCAEYITQLSVIDPTSGAAVLSGTMILDYTRTWNEIDPLGNMTQVWRFTAKADLSATAGAVPPPCIVPNCIAPVGPHPTAFYYGYVDYANCDPSTPFENVLVLYHNCDRFVHTPGLSDRPGVFHPGSSFGIVAPHSAVQPFIPGNAVASGGPVIGEATRNVAIAGTVSCMVEDRVDFGDMLKLGAGCLCTMSINPKQQTVREFKGQTSCINAAGIPGSWATVALNFPVLPWFHLVTTSFGSWANGNVYPGKESAWVDEGLFVVQDACTGDFAELKYGGSTRDGWTALLPVPVAVRNFTDLVDNYSVPLFGPYPTPVFGSVQPSHHLIYVNEP